MRKVKIEAYVDIEDVYIEVDDDADDEDIEHEVKFYVDERLHIGWKVEESNQ